MREIIAGVDEVGRGSLVGPVYAAAVILNKEINRKILKDSKNAIILDQVENGVAVRMAIIYLLVAKLNIPQV